MRHKELQIVFADLDRRYFGGQLGAADYRVEIAWVDRRREPGDDRPPEYGDNIGRCYPFRRLIQIDLSVRNPAEARTTLLHEMIHAAVELDRPLRKNELAHGKRFLDELERVDWECQTARPLHLADYSWLKIESDSFGDKV